MDIKVAGGAGRQRRRHSAEVKARVVEECRRPGISMAAVALANGINANLLRNWVYGRGAGRAAAGPMLENGVGDEQFVAAAPTASSIRIEVLRGATTVTVTWPAHAAGECAAWLRDWLR